MDINCRAIASGGYGSVSSIAVKDTLALKEMKCDSISKITRGVLEYSIMRSINHPGIIQVRSLNVKDNSVSYTMSLANQTSKVVSSQVVKWLRQIALTLDYMHKLGVIHGDVKFNNTVIDSNGNIKLIDFGMSRPLAWRLPEHTYTYTHRAPEVWKGERFNEKADVWSFGCMIFEFFGKSLIDYHNITPDTARESCLQQMRLIDDRLMRLPMNDQFKLIVRSCLNLDPNLRPSMEQVSTWLGNLDLSVVKGNIHHIVRMSRTRYDREVINLCLDIVMKLMYSYDFSQKTLSNVVNVSIAMITGTGTTDQCIIESGRILKYLQGYVSHTNHQLMDKIK
uniref:Protein kinase domain-containing protein n=1 Tax=viral metagenome TaxID=1070528 RepID=A0A6C0BN54_9ZZZZ